jgi:RecB family exonuclease
LDAYHADHLPAEIDGTILGGAREPMRAIHPCVVDLLGGLATEERRPLGEWPMIVRTFLATVYAGEIDGGREPDRVLAEALGDLAQVLAEIERLPAALAREPVAANEALDLVVTAVRGGAVPPAPSSPGTAEVELLGWLELPLDEARALVVTGFQEGFVPSVRRDDPFLPDGLRRRLGLPSADDRVARDVYAATVLLRSKQAIAFVSGRRNRDGDPRMPSRLAFHVPRERLLARVAAMAVEPAPRRSAPVRGGKSYEFPRLGKTPPVTSMPVTAFRTFLASPYLFYLERVLQLETVDDRARELDPAGFGSLAHDILQAFGESDARDSTDAKEIETWLRKRLEQVGRARFGPQPLPAVDLQLAQLGRRFALFARAQAARAAEGWRIHAAEWKPKAAVHLSMGDGEPPMELKGMIDRIDVHEATGAWSILDYKTSFLAKDPAGVHRKRSGWRDLQLPLYTLLAAELGHETVPTLGYFNLGKDEAGTGVRETGWTREDLDSAFEAAREVVVRIRGEEFFELGPSFADRGEILLAIAGKGLVLSETEESDDAEGEEGDA